MAQKFEYKFTRQNDYEELKKRYIQLEQQNYKLKESLQTLIKVNFELTESIEEFNNQNEIQTNENKNGNYLQMKNKMQELTLELQYFHNQYKNETKLKQSIVDHESNLKYRKQANKLVQVLDEVVTAFKVAQEKYEKQIQQLRITIERCQNQNFKSLTKLENNYQNKLQMIIELSLEIQNRNDSLLAIEEKVKQIQIEKNKPKYHSNGIINNNDRIESQEKNTIIAKYNQMVYELKKKLNQSLF